MFILAERRSQRRAKYQDAEKGKHDAEDEREHPRAHVREGAERIGGRFERDRRAEQDYQSARIEITLFQKRFEQGRALPAIFTRSLPHQAARLTLKIII